MFCVTDVHMLIKANRPEMTKHSRSTDDLQLNTIKAKPHRDWLWKCAKYTSNYRILVTIDTE